MKRETQITINEKMNTAAKMLDMAITAISEAASAAVLDCQFQYAENIINKARSAEGTRSGCLSCVIETHDQPKK